MTAQHCPRRFLTALIGGVAALFKKSPVGLKYTAGLDEATATFLQSVAWETVQDYYKP
jgi:hypothetical protein